MGAVIEWLSMHQLSAPFGWESAHDFVGLTCAVLTFLVGVIVVLISMQESEGFIFCIGVFTAVVIAPLLYILGLWIFAVAAGVTALYIYHDKTRLRGWHKY